MKPCFGIRLISSLKINPVKVEGKNNVKAEIKEKKNNSNCPLEKNYQKHNCWLNWFIICKKSKMAVWGGLTNSCEKKRGEKQRRKGKI